MPSNLCEKCQRIFDNWTDYTTYTIFQVRTAPEHYTISDLKVSANKGCHVCILFCNYHNERYERVAPSPEWNVPLRVFITGTSDQGDWTLNLWINNAIMSSILVIPSNELINHNESTLSAWTGSNASWSLVNKWYEQCRNSHEMCASNIRGHLPTRLLDLQAMNQGGDVRLCDTKGLQSQTPYATLSHCWGSLTVLKLTQRNAEQLYQKIQLADLCKTFQDAITIARSYKLNYLWIDSLCIKQDDPEDWKLESLRMSSVYGGSTLNIAAAGAQDGSAGCFLSRHPLASQRCHVELAIGDKAKRMLHECIPTRLYYHCVGGTPLGQRAWAFQERFLAPRTIHYGAAQLFWHCNQLDACEMYPRALPDHFRSDLTYQIKTLSPELWPSIVAQYTRCFLTQEADKLPAISGVARWIAEQSKDQYLAGLWRKDFVKQLLWHQDDKGINSPKGPEFYRAPSWSWASMEGAVDFSNFQNVTACQPRINILQLQIKTVNDDPFGQVLAGLLRLSCSGVLRGTFLDPEPGAYYPKIKLGDGTIISGYIIPKEVADFQLPFYLLPIQDTTITRDTKSFHTMQGLILRLHSSNKGQLFRVAYFSLDNNACNLYKEQEKISQNWIAGSECEDISGVDEEGVQNIVITVI